MFHGLKPMAIMIIPFVAIIIQVEARFAQRPLLPGESTIISATLTPEFRNDARDVTVTVPAAVDIQTPALYLPDSGELKWRLASLAAGEFTVKLAMQGQLAEKTLTVGPTGVKLSPVAYGESDIRALAYPFDSISNSSNAFESIELEYPYQRSQFIGISSATWILFGFTMLFGFAFRRLVGVTF
jgi:hypothetical protein